MQWHVPHAYQVSLDYFHVDGEMLYEFGLKLKTGKPLRFHWLGCDTDGNIDVRGFRNLSDGLGNACNQSSRRWHATEALFSSGKGCRRQPQMIRR
jgi:hypothetical protein